VPWTGFDLINAFNSWKKTEAAGRVFSVDTTGQAEIVVTGLPWRHEVCQQVFEEAAVDCGRALAAWSDSRSGNRKGKRVGFPRFKRKTDAALSFRLRNRHPKGRPPAIRVGDRARPRSITLPGIGQIGVHDDTRRLRRMLAKGRAKVLFATAATSILRAIRLMPAAGSVSTAAWRHSWSPPTRTAVKSPESRIHSKRWLPG
jgi:putative transposase